MAVRTIVCALSVLMVGCGGEPSPEASSGGEPSRSGGDLIPQSAIDSCAGMTPADAGKLVGVQDRELKDFSRRVGDSTRRQCVFNTETVPYAGLSFELAPEASAEAARAAMRSAREDLSQARRVIDGATGSQSKSPAIEEIAGVGDEAFVGAVNDALVVRVANVVVQVYSPQTLEAKKRVAEAVVQGIR